MGAIEIIANKDKFVIAASNKAELNNIIEKYPELGTEKDTMLLKEGEVIDAFNPMEDEEDIKNKFWRENYKIILALIVLLMASLMLFFIYWRIGR